MKYYFHVLWLQGINIIIGCKHMYLYYVYHTSKFYIEKGSLTI